MWGEKFRIFTGLWLWFFASSPNYYSTFLCASAVALLFIPFTFHSFHVAALSLLIFSKGIWTFAHFCDILEQRDIREEMEIGAEIWRGMNGKSECVEGKSEKNIREMNLWIHSRNSYLNCRVWSEAMWALCRIELQNITEIFFSQISWVWNCENSFSFVNAKREHAYINDECQCSSSSTLGSFYLER